MTEFTSIFRRKTYPAISPYDATRDQSERTVLIAGGSEGIGLHIAHAFASANAAKVILVARKRSSLDEATHGMNRAFRNTVTTSKQCDLSDASQIQELWKTLAEEQVCVDTLVLNAGPPAEEEDFAGAEASMRFGIISLLQMFHLFQSHNPNSAEQKVVINVTTAAVHCYPFPASGLAASRAGFVSYLGHISDHINESQMRIVNLHPGCVYTKRASQASGCGPDALLWDDPSLSAHMAVWVTDRNNAFLHGRFIWSNWDVEQLSMMKEQLMADPGLLKIGIVGVPTCSLQEVFKKCEQVSVP